MRGQQKLQPTQLKKTNKGRSQKLIADRDRALIWRYYYYSEVKRLRYDDIISELSNDFFISEHTVLARLVYRGEEIQQLITKRPSLQDIDQQNARFDVSYTLNEKQKYNATQ